MKTNEKTECKTDASGEENECHASENKSKTYEKT